MAENDEVHKAILLRRLDSYIHSAHDLISRCDTMLHVAGMSKLMKKCQAELKFLSGLKKKPQKLKDTHLSCTNLTHIHGVVEAAECMPHVTQVMQTFPVPDTHVTLTVDLICNHGYTWVKVVTRKAQALHLVWAGEGQFGERSIVDQAVQFQQCARLYPVTFRDPQVVFVCLAGVTAGLRDALTQAGVLVYGDLQPVTSEVASKLNMHVSIRDESSDEEEEVVDELEEEGEASHGILSASELFKHLQATNKPNALPPCDSCDMPSDTEALLSSSPPPSPPGTATSKESSLQSSSQIPNLQAAPPCEYSPQQTPPGDSSSNYHTSNHQNVPKLDCANPCATPISNSIPSCNVEALKVCRSTSQPPSTPWNLTEHWPRPNIDVTRLLPLLARVPCVDRVYLDMSTLISLASNVCHGACQLEFREEILNLQAQQERQTPLMPRLTAFMDGKSLVTCETAANSFTALLDVLGGPQERQRGHEFMQTVAIVPDEVSTRSASLQLSLKVKERSRIIFGTGDHLKAIIMTANSGFVRAASNQGVNFAVFLHEPRALTEQKEAHAVPLTSGSPT